MSRRRRGRLLSERTGTVRVVGQELRVRQQGVYTCHLLDWSWPEALR